MSKLNNGKCILCHINPQSEAGHSNSIYICTHCKGSGRPSRVLKRYSLDELVAWHKGDMDNAGGTTIKIKENMLEVRPDQSKYSFDIPTNKYGYTKDEWDTFPEGYRQHLILYHRKGITRQHVWETTKNNPAHFLNNIEARLINYSRDDEDDFSSEYWENHPRNCDKFVVLDCRCEMCFAERDDPYHPAHKTSSHRRD